MEWLNVFGLGIVAVMLVPNILFAVTHKDGFKNKVPCKGLEVAEQVGRFGCMGGMIFNIPATFFGWRSDEAFAVYLAVNALLLLLYCVLWAVCWRKNGVFKALTLSVIPSVIFLFSGAMSRSLVLILFALLFAPAHVLLSYKNAVGV